jgi:hypothetical protein
VQGMKKLQLIGICIALMVLLVVISVEVSSDTTELYCCCKPDNTTVSEAAMGLEDCGAGLIPKGPLEAADALNLTICTSKCAAGGLPPLPPPVGCVAGANLTPKNLQVSPVRGRQALHLEFDLACTPDYVEISRCQGAGGEDCGEFGLVADISRNSGHVSYDDTSADLLWNTSYTYEVFAYYAVNGQSDSNYGESNLGDIECTAHFDSNPFCISSYYYQQFHDYLQSYGYNSVQAVAFKNNFDSTVTATFQPRLNAGFWCNAANRITNIVSCN